jgi:NADH/F420H2 dehydrogenase subunit C
LVDGPYLLNLRLLFMLKSIVPFFFVKMSIQNDNNVLFIKKRFLLPLLFFVKKHSLLQYKTLSDIATLDFLVPKSRFKIIYNLLSTFFNNRLLICTKTNEVTPLNSVTNVFENANWLEREVWDMFGILFVNHPDLRRILTDYGFDGHPLRKDFPLTGFTEVFYSDSTKSICYAKVSLAQEYRAFEFVSPWSSVV